MKPASVSDYRELARRRLPPMFFEYIDGGSYAEVTLGRNVADLEAIALRQRVMRDMTQLDMSVEVFGQKLSMPVGLAPVGMAGMYGRRGEAQVAILEILAQTLAVEHGLVDRRQRKLGFGAVQRQRPRIARRSIHFRPSSLV